MFNRGHETPYTPYPEEENFQRHAHPEEPPKRDLHHCHHEEEVHHHGPPAHQCGYEQSGSHGAAQLTSGPYGGLEHRGGLEEERRPVSWHPPGSDEQAPRYPQAPYEGGERLNANHPPGPYVGGIQNSHSPPNPGYGTGGIQNSHYQPNPVESGYETGHHQNPNVPGQYGGIAHQTSPYAPGPGHSPGVGGMEGPPPTHIPGPVVRLYCKANPDFHLAFRPRQGAVMVHADPHDPYQMWIKDERMSTKVTDSTGSPGFALINKATGQALRHAHEEMQQCPMVEYEPSTRDESVLWSQSEDMGDGYRCIRLANKITWNLDVLRGDKKSGGIKDGAPVILFPWKKQENQLWKITHACESLAQTSLYANTKEFRCSDSYKQISSAISASPFLVRWGPTNPLLSCVF